MLDASREMTISQYIATMLFLATKSGHSGYIVPMVFADNMWGVF